jgi:hypothetical protein
MGASASTAAAAADAALSSPRVLALLARLAGADAIPLADVFWTDLLELRAVDEEDDDDDGTPRVALASVDPAALEETLGSRVADALVRNSARSGNLASLLVHAAKRLREVDVEETEEKGDRRRDRESSRATSDDRVVAATNGVVLVALVAKRLVEGRADDRGDGEGVGECVGHDIGRRRRERRPAWKAFCDARPREGGADAAPALETFLLAVVDAAREVRIRPVDTVHHRATASLPRVLNVVLRGLFPRAAVSLCPRFFYASLTLTLTRSVPPPPPSMSSFLRPSSAIVSGRSTSRWRRR